MTFDEWWDSLTTRDQRSMDRQLTKAAWQVSAEGHAAGKLEAAQTILKLWHDRESPIDFIEHLEAYVEELK